MGYVILTSDKTLPVPEEILERLRIQPGDRVEYVVDTTGHVRLHVGKRPLTELFGILGRVDDQPATVEEMDEAGRQWVADDNARILRGEE